ncbi:HTH_Tnp_Tc3_2 domain-containing protein [Trichonephila clavipes]|nr:HTH_Tnp_Tc3_2 domain-containing protein [Trichonephila clavipes]
MSSLGFDNDSKMMVMGVYVTAQVNPELQRRMRTGIYLTVTAKRNRRNTASDLSRQHSSATGTTFSRQTVYRRLGHIGLYARRPVKWVPLTATHCRLRLTWSKEHALWTPQQWSCVMFSEESRFSLKYDSDRILIWRATGTCYYQENTIERARATPLRWRRVARLGRNYPWFQNCPTCSECNDDRSHLSVCHSGTTCTFVSGRHGC